MPRPSWVTTSGRNSYNNVYNVLQAMQAYITSLKEKERNNIICCQNFSLS